MTQPDPECQVRLSGVPHYLVADTAAYLGVSERQIYRWFDDGVLTKKHYPDEDSKGICVPANEVAALGEKRDREREEARNSA